MRSIPGSLEQLQPLIDVSIGLASDSSFDRESYRALIDTGATRTCITGKVVSRFDLMPVKKLLVASATSSPERRSAYQFSLGLFCAQSATTGTTQTLYVIERPLIAPLFKDNDNFDVLLGMDLLLLGRLVFEANGEFSFSFDF